MGQGGLGRELGGQEDVEDIIPAVSVPLRVSQTLRDEVRHLARHHFGVLENAGDGDSL